MSGDRLTRLILFSGYIWGFCLASINQAQIVPDNTLNDESSTVVRDTAGNLNEIVDLIQSGAIRGDTLFHSFEEFNVLTDGQVYFANPSGIEQILTRITGNNPSNILGRLGVNGNADLFLLNPNGILFGENASLDVGGSFIATTADSFIFDDDLSYSATSPEIPPLLNINIPKGIQFGANAGTIEVRNEGHSFELDSSTLIPIGSSLVPRLSVPNGKTLALIGGEVNLNGGNLHTIEGKIELAAIAQAGEIELEHDNLFTFNYEEIDNFGNINLAQQSFLTVPGGKNIGSVNLRGNDITLRDGSIITINKLNPGKSQVRGEINIVATGSLNIINNAADTFPSGIFSFLVQPSNHPGPDIDINADKLQLQNNAIIVSSVLNNGQGGNIHVNARQIDLIDNHDSPYNAGIYSQALSGAKGDAGIITVETEDLKLLNGQKIVSIDDEDDLEDLIGEDRAEDLEDFIEDRNVVIGTSESGKTTLVFKGGGEISSINRGTGKSGIAIVAADTIQYSDNPQPEPEIEVPEPEIEVPEPEIEVPEPEIEVPEPEIEVPEPEIEIPNVSQDFRERVYVFELASGQKIVITAEDLIRVAQSESVNSLTSNSRNSKRKPIEIYAKNVSTIRTDDPNFDIPSACRLGDNNFVIIGKGGIAENPFNNIMQTTTVPDIEMKLPRQTGTTSAMKLDNPKYDFDLVVEAQNWKVNQSGKVELLASSSQKNTNSLADLPHCLKD